MPSRFGSNHVFAPRKKVPGPPNLFQAMVWGGYPEVHLPLVWGWAKFDDKKTKKKDFRCEEWVLFGWTRLEVHLAVYSGNMENVSFFSFVSPLRLTLTFHSSLLIGGTARFLLDTLYTWFWVKWWSDSDLCELILRWIHITSHTKFHRSSLIGGRWGRGLWAGPVRSPRPSQSFLWQRQFCSGGCLRWPCKRNASAGQWGTWVSRKCERCLRSFKSLGGLEFARLRIFNLVSLLFLSTFFSHYLSHYVSHYVSLVPLNWGTMGEGTWADLSSRSVLPWKLVPTFIHFQLHKTRLSMIRLPRWKMSGF